MKLTAAACLPVILLLQACSSAMSPDAFDGRTPEMRPEAFFSGRTVSDGFLETRSGSPERRFSVQGRGRTLADGTFQLEQTVVMEGSPPEVRTWNLHRVDVHRYEGSLSDASGPVRGQSYGNLFHVSYPMRSPPLAHMEQWLYLQPDGVTVINEATVSLFGITVAHLSERISHMSGNAD